MKKKIDNRHGISRDHNMINLQTAGGARSFRVVAIYYDYSADQSFFFSSRRRHTRSTRDWSSDVCSSDLYVLHHVEAHAPMRVSELAKCMELDSSTVSRHIRNLEEGGYLSRTDDPDDRRATRIGLTDSGRAVLDESTRARAAVVDEATAGWSEADRETLRTLMTRLAD